MTPSNFLIPLCVLKNHDNPFVIMHFGKYKGADNFIVDRIDFASLYKWFSDPVHNTIYSDKIYSPGLRQRVYIFGPLHGRHMKES